MHYKGNSNFGRIDAKQHFQSFGEPDSLNSFFGGVQVSFKEAA